MGMSTHVVGFRPPDAKWEAMKQVWDSCVKAGVNVPEAVDLFFDGEDPRDAPGREFSLRDCVKEWGDEGRQGFELDVSNLPANTTYIRFYNSY